MICHIQLSTRTPTETILLSASLMDAFRFTSGQSIRVEIGHQSAIARVVTSHLPGNRMILSHKLARLISLPHTGMIRAISENKSLKLGPVIGILTTGFTGKAEQPFGIRSFLFKGFVEAGVSENPFLYVFTPEMVNWKTKTVSGWYYRKGQSGTPHWMPLRSPLPDIIYERIPNRKSESLARVQSCLARFKESKRTKIFNQGFLNKWTVHQYLNQNTDTETYIPETYQSPSLQTLQRMVKEHQMVYLKPSKGSLGLGIFRITEHPNSGFYCRFHQGNRNVLHRFQSLDRLIRFYFGGGRSFHRYLVQQGIRLIRFQKRPVDFRVHMHKDRSGAWKIVGIGAKVAGPGSVTTHVRTGGSIISTDSLLKYIFAEKAPILKQSLEKAAIEIAKTLEKHVDGPLGELGMDMGIDYDHRIWLFECNSKPGRHIFHHPSLKEAGRQSAKCITEYSLKLSNFV